MKHIPQGDHIPDTASPDLRAARASAYAAEAVAAEIIRQMTAERDAMIAAEQTRRNGNGHKDSNNIPGRPS